MNKSPKFPFKLMIGEAEVILDFNKEQQDFSWECGDLGGMGFSSLERAEDDATFWVMNGHDYLYTEQVIRSF